MVPELITAECQVKLARPLPVVPEVNRSATMFQGDSHVSRQGERLPDLTFRVGVRGKEPALVRADQEAR